MYYYFSANREVAIKLNGIYFGKIFDTVKHINIESTDTLIEICPLDNTGLPFSFILTADFLSNPPDNVKVVDMVGGYLILFDVKYFESKFRLISQKKCSYAIINLFCDNGIKLTIETPNAFYTERIDFFVENAEIFELDNNALAILLKNEQDTIFVYSTQNKVKKIFSYSANSIKIDNFIQTNVYKKDLAKHIIITEWKLNNEQVSQVNHTIKSSDSFVVNNLSPKILPYAFFEELCLFGDVTPFLSDNMIEKKDKLINYLGNFIGVMPPPFFRNYNEIGLIYKQTDNLYAVKYATTEITNGKISNLRLT